MKETSVLYIVATPIGNLDDISSRAIEVLGRVDLILAEDTRHSKKLLQHHAVTTTVHSYHEHNEDKETPRIIEKIRQGTSVALISDAGTPLLSDPGYRLVNKAHEVDIKVIPVPGATAAIAALSASGIATDRFVFEGFVPSKSNARKIFYKKLETQQRTIILYESCHRIVESLRDLKDVFGENRIITFARELTKTFETIKKLKIGECLEWVEKDDNQEKGEIVLILAGTTAENNKNETELKRVLSILLGDLSVKHAAQLASKITGINKNVVYRIALDLKGNDGK